MKVHTLKLFSTPFKILRKNPIFFLENGFVFLEVGQTSFKGE